MAFYNRTKNRVGIAWAFASVMVIALVASLLPVVTATNRALAYQWHGCRFPSPLSIQWYVPSPHTLFPSFANAAHTWTQRASDVALTYGTTGGKNQIRGVVYNTNNGYRGWWNNYVCYRGEYVSVPAGQLMANWYYLDTDVSNRRQSTLTHEFGHALGLAHVYEDCDDSLRNRGIMHPKIKRYDNCGWYTPRTDDVNGVNDRYPGGAGK